jgi:hypothetical protein
MGLKLQQGQVWKHGKEFVRIVHLARLEVGYKVMKDLKSGEGAHHHTSKKDFCRLLKSATLLRSKQARSAPSLGATSRQADNENDIQ